MKVTESCPARIGLMGNPSDGFQGKTISFLIDNFSACVTIEEYPWEKGICIQESATFATADALVSHSQLMV